VRPLHFSPVDGTAWSRTKSTSSKVKYLYSTHRR